MTQYRKFITKSRAGHYTATIFRIYADGRKQEVFKAGLLATKQHAQLECAAWLASQAEYV